MWSIIKTMFGLGKKNKQIQKKLWVVLSVGSGLGLLASFIQTVERIDYAKNPQVPLSCDLNAIFSCSNVFDAWQSSVFGFSNSLLCIVFFAVSLGVALVGATSSVISSRLRQIMHFFAFFFLGFGAWYLWQSTYYIGYICIFCIICYSAVILMNVAWLRINKNDLGLSRKNQKYLDSTITSNKDIFLWLAWAIIIASMIIFKFI